MATVDVKQYIDQLAQTAGLTQEEKDAILKVASNEKFSKALGDDILRQQDYSRQSDALRADRQKWEGFYKENLTWRAAEEARVAQILAEANGNRQVIEPVQGDFLSKKDFEAELTKQNQQRDAQVVNLLKDGMFLASQHAVEFKEALDTEALAKIATEKGMTLRAAYAELVGSRRAELATAHHKAELETAKAEAVRDYAAKHHIPVDTQPKEYHVMFDRDPAKQVEYTANTGRLSSTAERTLRSNFVDSWNEAGAKTSGT